MNAGAENLTPEDIEELKEAFSLLDKDGDGATLAEHTCDVNMCSLNRKDFGG